MMKEFISGRARRYGWVPNRLNAAWRSPGAGADERQAGLFAPAFPIAAHRKPGPLE